MESDQVLSFLSLADFDQSWVALGLDDKDLARLQMQILAHPESGAVIPQTNGVRKLRFALPGKGKSGGVRVCYAYLPSVGFIMLCAVYSKNERTNLDARSRKQMSELITLVKKRLLGA